MFNSKNTDQWKTIEPIVARYGATCLGFETTQGRSQLLRIFIDCDKGVSVEDCARISKAVMANAEDISIPFDRLEVSSPGSPRVIFSCEELVSFMGQEIKIRLRFPMNGMKNFSGVAEACTGDQLKLRDEQNQKIEIEFNSIKKIQLKE